MKRKLLKFLVLCLSLTILAGCGSEKPLEPVEGELLSRSDALFMVKVQDANHATVTFKNLAETYLYIGHESKLHMRRDGVWYNIPIIEDKRWPEYSLGLPLGGKKIQEMVFEEWYGSLEPGEYRLIKPVYGGGDPMYVFAEFVIE